MRAGALPALLLCGLTACKGDSHGPTHTIESLSLKIDLPEGLEFRQTADNPRKVSLSCGAFGVLVAADGLNHHPTLEEGKKKVADYGPQNVRTEALADGWAMTFENVGASGRNYWVETRRQIDGKAYWCGSTNGTAEQQATVLAACKSLRPL